VFIFLAHNHFSYASSSLALSGVVNSPCLRGVIPAFFELQLSWCCTRVMTHSSQHDSRGLYAHTLFIHLYYDACDDPISIFANELLCGRIEPHLDTCALEGRAMYGVRAVLPHKTAPQRTARH